MAQLAKLTPAELLPGSLKPYFDPREVFQDKPPSEEDFIRWRRILRGLLFFKRGQSSDLSRLPLTGRTGYHMHEGIFPRQILSGVSWYWMLHAEPNCFLLIPDEHSPQPPSRTLCYWLSVALQGDKSVVDEWIDSLPFKVRPERPWAGTHGLSVLWSETGNKIKNSAKWREFYLSSTVKTALDTTA